MKKTIKAFGIIALVAVIGFGVVACGDSDDGGGTKGEYNMKWKYASDGYSTVEEILDQGDAEPVPESVDGAWALYTLDNAIEVFDDVNRIIMNNWWDDDGELDGSFEDCIGFTMSGITAPPGLKTAANTHKGKVPLAGIYKVSSTDVVLVYIRKN